MSDEWESGPPPGDRPRLARTLLAAALAALVLAELALLVVLAAHRPFQVDEVEHIHAAYEISAGRLIYRDFRQTHDPLLYLLLAPVIDPGDPVASYLHCRVVSTAMLLGTFVLVGVSARRLSTTLGGVLAVGLALADTTLVGRGIEVRPDVGVALCVAGALAVELSGWPRGRRYAVEALLLSGAYLFTNKAVFACFAFGCLWLVSAVRERSPRLVLRPMAAWLAPLAVAAMVMAWRGNLRAFLRLNVVGPAAVATGFDPYTFSFWPGGFLVNEGARNLLFSALAVAGLAYGALAWAPDAAARGPRAVPGLRFTAFLGAVLLASLWCNPFPFPYLHLTVLPTLTVLGAVLVARAAERWRLTLSSPGGLGLVLGIVALAAAPGAPYLSHLAGLPQGPQFDTLRQIQRVTGPDDRVFDMAGLYFRPDAAYAYLMTNETLARYQMGGLPAIPGELRRNRAVAYVDSYRIGWLGPVEQRFLSRHFTHYDRNLFLLGTDLSDLAPGATRSFEVLAGRRFRHEGSGAILVDGSPFDEGFLSRGWHRIERPGTTGPAGPDRLILATPPPVPWPPRPPRRLYEDFDGGPSPVRLPAALEPGTRAALSAVAGSQRTQRAQAAPRRP